ncbi:hypothetical protein [Bradyrhizobium sp. Ai1a-2]|uniref:hypothetical protein n=1 Tax=Bradyrhizobium sp. Ai1a-2 TaxID=196490 RepID=UPI0012691995|nr:hypothetical protein [Bradyrhizobium sp. Ai1a-2]
MRMLVAEITANIIRLRLDPASGWLVAVKVPILLPGEKIAAGSFGTDQRLEVAACRRITVDPAKASESSDEISDLCTALVKSFCTATDSAEKMSMVNVDLKKRCHFSASNSRARSLNETNAISSSSSIVRTVVAWPSSALR